MILEIGLKAGVRALWEKDMFLDLTLKVESQEFRVHKVVLASVSDYFCAMFNGSLMESESTTIELKELDADRVSNLIEFIYTGEDRLIKYRPGRVLEYAVYFQMPGVIRECINMMLNLLTVDTCLELLSVFTTYSLEVGLSTVKAFIKKNLKAVKDRFKPEEMTPEMMQVVLDSWTQNGSEWQRFEYIKTWISVDYDERKEHIDKFMSHVRFSLMTREEILTIKEMAEYTDAEEAWKDLVDKAFSFQQLPPHLKIQEHSEQSKLRWAKAPVIINIGEDGSLDSYTVRKDKQKRSHWYKYGSQKGPSVTGSIPYVLEVNNYLVTCSEFGENQEWRVLEPLALTWSSIANLPKPRDHFALLHHDKQLYVLGGREGIKPKERKVTDRIEEYSFATNSWSSTRKLPVALRNHSTCVYNNAIYVSGGVIEDEDGNRMSDRLDRLDLTSNTWESKAPMKKKMADHKMFVMRIMNKNTIVVINHDVNGCLEIWYYNPRTDVWSTDDIPLDPWGTDCSDWLDSPIKDVAGIKWVPECRMLHSANTVYLLKLHGEEYKEIYTPYDSWELSNEMDLVQTQDICVKWRFPVDEQDPEDAEISQIPLADFPVTLRQPQSQVNFIAGVIALPPRASKKKK